MKTSRFMWQDYSLTKTIKTWKDGEWKIIALFIDSKDAEIAARCVTMLRNVDEYYLLDKYFEPALRMCIKWVTYKDKFQKSMKKLLSHFQMR